MVLEQPDHGLSKFSRTKGSSGSGTSEATPRPAMPSGLRAHHRWRVEIWPCRKDLSRHFRLRFRERQGDLNQPWARHVPFLPSAASLVRPQDIGPDGKHLASAAPSDSE